MLKATMPIPYAHRSPNLDAHAVYKASSVGSLKAARRGSSAADVRAATLTVPAMVPAQQDNWMPTGKDIQIVVCGPPSFNSSVAATLDEAGYDPSCVFVL